MSGADDSFVLVGGRNTLPKLHLEAEDNNSSSLRSRRNCSQASTPDSNPNQTYSIQVSNTPGGTPKTSTQYTRRTKGVGSPTLKDLREGPDSGYSGWKDSTSAKKHLRFDPYGNPDGSFVDSKGSEPSLWDSFASPVLDFKRKLQGRQSFLDDSPVRARKVQPQQLLAGIIVVVMVASICFAVLIGVTHFSNFTFLDGKRRSIKFGTEKKLETMKEAGQLLDRDMVDESGAMLGGKRAAIQYAYETGVESGGFEKAPNPEAASLTRLKAKALDHLDLVELVESVGMLKEMMEADQLLDQNILEKVNRVLHQADAPATGRVQRGSNSANQFRFREG